MEHVGVGQQWRQRQSSTTTELNDNGAGQRSSWLPLWKKTEFGGEQCVRSVLIVVGVLIFNSYVKFEKFGVRSKYVIVDIHESFSQLMTHRGITEKLLFRITQIQVT